MAVEARKMFREQWNTVNQALSEYEGYEKRVQEYLLFLTGYHTKTELEKCMDDAPRQIKRLMQERNSPPAELITRVTGGYAELKSMQLSASEEYGMAAVHREYLNISRNTMSWLSAAELYCRLFREGDVITK
ncbi:MAG: hypothetical protein NC337_05520 [Roseburia sp.]|nr:hypothetical protein [Roseburia sp.]